MTIGIDSRSLEDAPTGVARYLLNLLENWSREPKHRIILYFKERIPAIGILENPCYAKKILKAPLGVKSNFLFQHLLLPRAAKKDQTDILFSPAYILPILYDGKSAVAIHDISYEIFPENIGWLDKLFLREISKISANRASVILTVSEFSKKEIVARYKIPADKIFVAYLGADKNFLNARESASAENIKAKFNINEQFVVSAGTLFNRRHPENLIEAFRSVAEKFPGCQLLIIGRNHTCPFTDIDGKITAANAKLKRRAILRRDSVSGDDLAALFGRAAALVYLSDYEGFGLPPLEAAAAGTPAIVSKIPAISEVMGDAAFFIKDNNSISEISQAIEKIMTDEKLRYDLAGRGKTRAELFSWKECARKTIEILEKYAR